MTGEAGGGLEAVCEVADEEVVHIGQVQAVVSEILLPLEAQGVVHGLHGFRLAQLVLAEDKKPGLVKVAVKAVPHLVHLAFNDPPHGESHGPIGKLLGADVTAALEAVGIPRFQDFRQFFVLGVRRDAGDVRHQGCGGLLGLLHGPGDLDAQGMSVQALQVGTVPSHE